ncbi:MAG: hypothetical protein JXA00_04020 [Candidatus Thermoplasmatota archaeon]|nr:hypothetical protein [Candidatus Thermoplasmatota archaeon]
MVFKSNLLMLTVGLMGAVFLLFQRKKEQCVEPRERESGTSSMLCKFVHDCSGRKIGESVSLDQDILIIKSGSQFLGVPLKHVEETEHTLVVKGIVDFSKAYTLGEKWRKESHKEMNQHGCSEGTTR